MNSSEKCCSPFTCSNLSTVEGGRGFAWRTEGGRAGEMKRGRKEEGLKEEGRKGRQRATVNL